MGPFVRVATTLHSKVSNYSCAYSASACFRSGMSGSVSFHKERKLLSVCERRMGHPS
jgi:hypothetical protein